MDYTRIRTKVEDGIETITLDYQQTLNAVDLTMALELEDALTKADKDEEVKVIVMEGAGRAFSAGGDIRYMKAHCEKPDFATKSMAALAGKLAEDIIHMKKLSKIIVCAVHGACAGGGMNLALGADYVICSDDAKFIQAFAGIALCPDTGAVFLLPRIIGANRALDLFVSGRQVKADEALAIGLVKEVVPKEKLDETVHAFAKKLTEGPLLAYQNSSCTSASIRVLKTTPSRKQASSANALPAKTSRKASPHSSKRENRSSKDVNRKEIMKKESFQEGPYRVTLYTPEVNTKGICYFIQPADIASENESLADRLEIAIAAIDGLDWSNDLSPWEAPGIFKREGEFGGGADVFEKFFLETILPDTEKRAGLDNPERQLVGISLSGMFALYAACHTDAFSGIASISGSFWFTGLLDYYRSHPLSPAVRRVYLSLGAKEPKTRREPLNTILERTEDVLGIVREEGKEAILQMNRGGHYVHRGERLEEALRYLLSGAEWKGEFSL